MSVFTFGFEESHRKPQHSDLASQLKPAKRITPHTHHLGQPHNTHSLSTLCACRRPSRAHAPHHHNLQPPLDAVLAGPSDAPCSACGLAPLRHLVTSHAEMPELMRGATEQSEALRSSDLLPGVYEGGFVLWECARDLLEVLHSLLERSELDIATAAVLEAGCGAGLPGVLALQRGCRSLSLHDFNEEVLLWNTLPNIWLNGQWERVDRGAVSLFSGDWATVSELLSSERAALSLAAEGFDLILTADSIYSTDAAPRLYQLIVDQLRRPSGVALVAAKSYYFGVGGSVAHFRDLVERGGLLEHRGALTIEDGSSNRREVLELRWKT